ncbi:hypothetical protein HBH56_104570 [Parastagonospora nodorum]|uniref:Uncharacterized protein n=2 Tax=Phaeosphaeria nodorum (strain SN15 / ATCC MYA-4574 / FGSC 10173) TaxID=321614 RepID=A0A7U2FG85_PHANO|nr:hypothetical protein SNOG_10631 [Parastagonospora nodorum SN15]KAH3913553.1 hypothetical protein HBH56_104570 [Parastagonospora nodorum]EAT82025.1 hypothetical protein SNOG_10631 [Parastagonospora nodorum SN15]KAH3929170.1 hypothetical protein HBH54_125830 [Parastagonospora nodorum]KAH4137900.1 hypothetical protein HBH45_119970 [Parastagonospora nodorum]KAH4171965.1 hypothetical protein HBH44_028990 [Parastagonospora nodorum]
MSNSTVSTIPLVIIHKPATRPPLPQRRVTCSFLEPIEGRKRSSMGKPYSPPRMKSPAPENMINRANSLRKPMTTRTNSMPVRPRAFMRRAMSKIKRTNSGAIVTNSTMDIGEAKKWSLQHSDPPSPVGRRPRLRSRKMETYG